MPALRDQPGLFDTELPGAPVAAPAPVIPPDRVTVAELAIRLDAGATVIVPTAAAAEVLRRAADTLAASRGLRVWEPRAPFTFASWTASLWTRLLVEGREDRTLLNGLQERALWQSVLAAQPLQAPIEGRNLQQDLAAMAAAAHALAEAALLPLTLRAYTQDTRAFAAWSDAFRARCQRLAVLPAASLPAALATHLREGSLTNLPRELDIAGFVEHSAAQLDLLAACREAGITVREHHIETSGRVAHEVCDTLPTPDAELRFVAARIDSLVRERLSGALSTHIAVIVPQPEAERAEIESVFRAILAPELTDLALSAEAAPWSVSAGPPLAAEPASREALDLLRGLNEPLPLDRGSALLLSPNLGEPGYRDVRARLDTQILRRQARLRPELTLAQLERTLDHSSKASPAPPALAWLRRTLGVFADRSPDPARTRSYADWGELTRALLEAAAWSPVERVRDAFETALDQLATLDLLHQRIDFPAFLQALERAAHATRLACASPDPALRIDVLTLEEIEGAAFDAAFVLRSTDRELAATPRPHPLLPWELQRAHRLPGANPSVDAERGRQRLRSLLDATPAVLFTSAEQEADGPLRASPLPAELGCTRLPVPEAALPVPALALERILDDLALPPLPSAAEVRSGTRVLQLQAACPFRAFAELRLAAEPLEQQQLGLDPRQTGELVHTTMERFWEEQATRSRLAAMSTEERADAILRAADAAFEQLHRRNGGLLDPASDEAPWDEAYLRLEHERLLALAAQWLEQELRREDFTVEPPEQTEPIQIGPLRLTLRPDRRDLTPDGGVVIVDYKTGAAGGPKAWEGERPDEPQIPLYALSAEAEPDRLRAVTLARIRAGEGEMCWDGLQADEDTLPGRNRVIDMPAQIVEWRVALHRLATQFAEGVVTVDPKHPGKTCTHCGQRMLCRLDVNALHAAGETTEDGGEATGDGAMDG